MISFNLCIQDTDLVHLPFLHFPLSLLLSNIFNIFALLFVLLP